MAKINCFGSWQRQKLYRHELVGVLYGWLLDMDVSTHVDCTKYMGHKKNVNNLDLCSSPPDLEYVINMYIFTQNVFSYLF